MKLQGLNYLHPVSLIFLIKYDPPTNKENLFKLIVKNTKKFFFSFFCAFDHHREDSITNFFLTPRGKSKIFFKTYFGTKRINYFN